MRSKGILVFYHCRSNTGYAIEKLEKTFFKAAFNFKGSSEKIHIGYLNLKGGRPKHLPKGFNNILEIDTRDGSPEHIKSICSYIKDNEIDVALGFDQPVSAPVYGSMRKAGIRLFVSYWGAPMSSLNKGFKLALKRLEVRLKRHKPDHFVFESQAMADTAVFGRGIHPQNVSVISLGVDTDKYKPQSAFADYAYREFSIPRERKIVFFSGHMEERKGVQVIVKAAVDLIEKHKRNDLHFLLLGNQDGEEKRFDHLYRGLETEKHITFGGYRGDIPTILPSCYLGVIASTGWDSFTMSSVEMAASGLPLVVSALQGLKETVQPDKTGLLFTPGDHFELAEKIKCLVDDPCLRNRMSEASRVRAVEDFSEKRQVEDLTSLLQRLYSEVVGG